MEQTAQQINEAFSDLQRRLDESEASNAVMRGLLTDCLQPIGHVSCCSGGGEFGMKRADELMERVKEGLRSEAGKSFLEELARANFEREQVTMHICQFKKQNGELTEERDRLRSALEKIATYDNLKDPNHTVMWMRVEAKHALNPTPQPKEKE